MIKTIFVTLIVFGCGAIFAQPMIKVVPEILESDTIIPLGYSSTYGHIFDPIYIKNTGAVPVELGLSGSFDYRHLDTIGLYGDTMRVSAHFGDSLGFSWTFGDPFDIVAQFPRFCSDGFYGASGISLDPGDSVFIMFTVSTHTCPVIPSSDTLRIFIFGLNGADIDTAIVKKHFLLFYCSFEPPDSVTIDSINAMPGSERVFLSTVREPWMVCMDYFNVYRDTTALFYMSQIDSSNLLPDHAVTRFFTDSFDDPHWPGYWLSSKGVSDTLVNLFYVFTAVDTGATAPGGFSETPYPSNLVCEYDQGMKADPIFGSVNIISIPCYDERYRIASDLADYGIKSVEEWNPQTQTWTTVGRQAIAVPPVWAPDGSLKVSHTYRVSGYDMSSDTLFSTFTPGIVPSQDTVYTLYSNPITGDRNIVILPFKTSYIDGIHDCISLATSIEAAGAYRIYQVDRWNNETQTWSVVGSRHPIFGWTNGPVRPGLPYRIWVDNLSPISWPLSR